MKSTLPEPLRGYSEGAVEFARRVLPRDDFGQLHDCVVRVVLAQPREEFVRDFAARYCHRVGVSERDPLGLGVERARLVFVERVDLLVGDSQLAADRSVYVLSKLAAVVPRDASVDERPQARVCQTGAVNPLPHRARASEYRGPTRVDEMIRERRAPLLRLRFEDAARVVVGLVNPQTFYPQDGRLLDLTAGRSYNHSYPETPLRQPPQASEL